MDRESRSGNYSGIGIPIDIVQLIAEIVLSELLNNLLFFLFLWISVDILKLLPVYPKHKW